MKFGEFYAEFYAEGDSKKLRNDYDNRLKPKNIVLYHMHYMMKEKEKVIMKQFREIVKNKKTNAYEMENGCLINIYGVKSEHIKNLVWVPLKYEFCFNCCHINITKEIDNDKINIYNNVYDNEKVKTIFIGCINRWNN